MIDADDIARARAHRVEDEIERRNIKLRGRVERVGPCPVCGGTDRFGINIRKQVFNCRGCGVGGDVIALVQHLDRADFQTAIETLTGPLPLTAADKTLPNPNDRAEAYQWRQQRKAEWLWEHRQPIYAAPAERYLREIRGYRGVIPPTLDFLPPQKPGHHPAMIAAFALPHEHPVWPPRWVEAVHLTLLKPDGSGKADIDKPKIIVGRPLGRPIVLAPPSDLLGLAITEGIEDALSVHAATGLGVWAAGDAGRMPALADKVPGYIETVTIFAHADQPKKPGQTPPGQAGATALAEKLHARGIEVLIEGLAT